MKTMKIWVYALLASWLISATQADEGFDQANTYYEQGNFKEAAEAYENIYKKSGPSVGLLQNLGSAYYRMGNDARAILAFERALLLKPRDPDLLANLKLAQDEAAVFPVENADEGRTFLHYLSDREWSVYLLIASLSLPLLAGVWVYFPKKYRWASLSLVGVSVIVIGLSIYALSHRGDEKVRGVVIADPTEVKVSPFENAETRGTIASGREVKLGKEESGYLWVTSDAGALNGWVKKESLARIIPESF